MRPLIVLAAGLATVFALGSDLAAKDNPGKGKKGREAVLDAKPGNGPKVIPPGQIKRYTRGAKLPVDLRWDDIGDLSRWKLKPPGRGNRYIRVDDQILEVTEDLTTVIDAIGIVSDLLR